MKTLNEGVVENEHDGCEIEGALVVPEDHLSEITDIAYFGVTQAKFPNLY